MRSDPLSGLNRVLSSSLRLKTAVFLFFFMAAAVLCPFGPGRGCPQDGGALPKKLSGWAGALGPREAAAIVVVPVDTPITDLAARAKTGLVQLVWSNQSGVMRYDVYRTSEYSPFAFEKIGETNSAYSTYLDPGLESDVTYLYKVYAVYSDQSLESQVVSARPPSRRVIANYPPVFYTEPGTSGIATWLYEYTARATDPNADALTYDLAAAPDGMTIDPGSGAISWTPPGPSGGSYPVAVTASDGKGGTSTQRFTIVALDEPPTARIAGDGYRWVNVGDIVQLDGSGSTDPDGDPLNYQWSYSTLHGGSGVFSDPSAKITTFQPLTVGYFDVSLIVNDGQVWSNQTGMYVIAPPAPPEVSLSAAPASIVAGDSATLTWNAQNADSCTIEPGIGTVAVSGSITVTPGETTTYTITAIRWWETWNADATARATVVVTYPAPAASISANPTTVQAGGSVSLAWNSTNADSVSIEPGIGSVAVSGSITVTPTLPTTTYTITASGRGGAAKATAAVTVIYPAPTASLSASPASIVSGQSATLAWSTANADTVSIDHGIGVVAASGSITVTPAQTTTYTITATGPGGTKMETVTVTVTYPVPTVAISANPASITVGEPSTLSWTSTGADSCTIEPGVGSVAVSGSMAVAPTQTTTYTITATGPGGTKTASATVTVTHLTPTVTLSIDPATIQAGQSALLTWSSTNADTVTIDQGIGSVAQNGSMAVSPARTTTYTITATGAGGTATAGATLAVTAMTMQITFPVDGDLVTGPEVTVRGVLTRETARETAVLVNGVIADVYGNEFVANRVPVDQGENTLTAVATDVLGNTAIASITVQGSAEEEYVELYPVISSGVVPIETTLTIDASFGVSTQSISCSGPAEVEIREGSNSSERQIKITAEGVYQFTVEATDAQGTSYSGTVAIVAYNRTRMDDFLKAKWDGMKGALLADAIEDALGGYFVERSREKYRMVFTPLSSRLPGIVSAMQNIEMTKCVNRSAEYSIDRVHSIGGQDVTLTYLIYFEVDEDGFWKIARF